MNHFIWFLKLSCELGRPTLTMDKSLSYGWVNWSSLMESHTWTELDHHRFCMSLQQQTAEIPTVYQSVVEYTSCNKLTKWKWKSLSHTLFFATPWTNFNLTQTTTLNTNISLKYIKLIHTKFYSIWWCSLIIKVKPCKYLDGFNNPINTQVQIY